MTKKYIGVLIVLLQLTCCYGCIDHLAREKIVGTIDDKVIKRYDNSDTYLIFVKKENGSIVALRNTDSILEGKFDSTTTYANLEVGGLYEFEVYGWRIPVFSMYQNIVSIRKIK